MTNINIGAADNDGTGDALRNAGRKINKLFAGVESATVDVGAATATLGNLYIVPASATGDWLSQDNNLAYYNGTAWEFSVPEEGLTFFVKDTDIELRWNGTAWVDTDPAGAGGTVLGKATRIRRQSFTRGSNQVVSTGNAGVVVQFGTLDTSPEYEDLGITEAAGVFTIPAALDGTFIRVSAKSKSDAASFSSGSYWFSYVRKNTGEWWLDEKGHDRSGNDFATVTDPIPVATGDTLDFFVRGEDNNFNLLTDANTNRITFEVYDEVDLVAAAVVQRLGIARFTAPGGLLTALNSGTPVFNEQRTDGTWLMEITGGNGNSFSFADVSGDFDKVFVIEAQLPDDANAAWGVFVGDASTGDKSVFMFSESSNSLLGQYFNGTGFTSNQTGTIAQIMSDPMAYATGRTYVRVERAGATVNIYMSKTGLSDDWVLYFTDSATADGLVDIDQVGLYLESNSVTAGDTVKLRILGYDDEGQEEATTGGGGESSSGSSFSGATVRVASTIVGQDFSTPAAFGGYDALVQDAGGWSDIGGANPGRLTVPEGVTSVDVSAAFFLTDCTSGEEPIIQLLQNGAVTDYTRRGRYPVGSSQVADVQFTHQSIPCSPGDYFEVRLQSGGDTSINIGSGSNFSIRQAGSGGGGSGSGSFTLDGATDTDTNRDNLTIADLGRLWGVKDFGGGVFGYGLLDTVANINPLGGGADLLINYDHSVDGNTNELEITDIDQYNSVLWLARGVEMDGTVNYALSTNNGGSDISHNTSQMFLEDASGNGKSDTVAGSSFAWMVDEADCMGSLRIDGLGTATPLLNVQRRFGSDATSVVYEERIHEVAAVNSMRIFPASGNITAGRIVAIGIKATIQPIPLLFPEYSGSPAGVETLARIVVPYNITIPAGASGSFITNSNPGGAATIAIEDDGVSIGTITVAATTGICTVNFASDANVDAGSILRLRSDGAETFVNLLGGLQAVGRSA